MPGGAAASLTTSPGGRPKPHALDLHPYGPYFVPMRNHQIRAAMVGAGMIFDETYRPFFEQPDSSRFAAGECVVDVRLAAVASRSGARAAAYALASTPRTSGFRSFSGPGCLDDLLASPIDAVCVATPDDRHFPAALAALRAGKHVLIEKPSVLTLGERQVLLDAAARAGVLVKVVYHKLADPDHKKLRTHVADGTLRHVNSGYCSLLEPRSVSRDQFAEWVVGRNPATYVGVHYLKLIDFTFGPDWRLARVSATGQRGIVGAPDGQTFDSVLTQVVYAYSDGREAAFDIHTGWVTPDNFPGYVDQEVQFRFDNAVWNAHQRKRGVEVTVEGRTPHDLKETPNHHYNGTFLEPWGQRSQRGYGIEVIRRFFEEVAHVEVGGPDSDRQARLAAMTALEYNDLGADRNVIAAVQAVEAILREQSAGRPGAVAFVDHPLGELVMLRPGDPNPTILHP